MENEGLDWKEDVNIETRIEVEPIENALHSVKLFINDILEKTNAEHYKIFLTGKGNFRDEIATILPYKGGRTAAKPVHYTAIREYLTKVWDAEIVDGLEADDLMSIYQCKDLYEKD